MKTVAQTVIEADRFYTIAAKGGSVIQAVEKATNGGDIRLGKYEHKPEQEWAFVREGDGVYRIRNRASGKLLDLTMTGLAAPVGGCGRHLSDVDRGAHPRRHRPSALFLGQRQVHRYRGHGCQRWCHPADLAGGRRR